jgi:glyoxylase-like metal-dependent hydrolase (beta-lactamase superfamily II)
MMDAAWTEIATGVHQRRYEPLDVSVVAIDGKDGLLLVDTRCDPAEADELIAEVTIRFSSPIRWVVNTHAHFDHSFGNQRFGPASELDVPIYGHRNIRRHYAEFEAPRLEAYLADPSREPDRNWQDVILTPPTHDVSERTSIDIGGRLVELVPLAPGHTDTDIALLVPDARLWILGDVVEESGPPMYGSGSFPLGWPAVLDALLDEMHPFDIVLPGHGRIVDHAFVAAQASELRLVADRILDANARNLTTAEALGEHSDWPFPVDGLVSAFDRGLSQLRD